MHSNFAAIKAAAFASFVGPLDVPIATPVRSPSPAIDQAHDKH